MSRQGASDDGLVRHELEKVLGSETFAQSESLKRFLRYVVEAKLDGREGELKEQVLGADVFERGDAYDPRIDPIVRVQATRLRSKLRDYYLAEGARSELVIQLPKGSYVPSFSKSLTSAPKTRRLPGKPLLVAGIAVLLALIALLVVPRFRNGADALPTSSESRSIAVLPFTDMSPERDHEYFGDGLAEEITTALASVEGLEVVPRTSAFRFKGERVDLKTIASELGSDLLLQGSVRVSDGKLRVQVQLIRAEDGRQLWAETYDRPLEDAFEVQEDIARSVARAVEKKLSHPRSEDERYIPATGAYDDFLRGTFEREKNTPLSLARSIELFQSAIEKDPDFAPAHAGLVQSYALNLLWGFAPPSESREAARKASERALALAGDHPEALAAAACYRITYDGDLTGAEDLLSRSGDREEIRPVRGIVLAARGRLDEAAREMDRATSLARHRPLPHYFGRRDRVPARRLRLRPGARAVAPRMGTRPRSHLASPLAHPGPARTLRGGGGRSRELRKKRAGAGRRERLPRRPARPRGSNGRGEDDSAKPRGRRAPLATFRRLSWRGFMLRWVRWSRRFWRSKRRGSSSPSVSSFSPSIRTTSPFVPTPASARSSKGSAWS